MWGGYAPAPVSPRGGPWKENRKIFCLAQAVDK